MINRLVIIQLIAVSSYSIGFAQTARIDSLKTAIAAASEPNKKAELYDALDNQFPNPNDKLIYARQAYRLFETVSLKWQISLATNLAISHGMLGRLDSSEFYFNKSLGSSLLSEDSAQISTGYNGMGNIHRMQGNLETSLSFFLKALDFADGVPRKTWKGDVLTNIGGLYYDLQDYDASLNKVVEARRIYMDNNDTLNIGFTSTLLGIVHKALNHLEEAEKYNKEALQILIVTKDTVQIIYNQNITVSILIDKGELDRAAKLATETIALARKFGERDPEITCLLTLSGIYFRQGKLDESNKLIDEALKIARLVNFRNQLPRAYSLKSLLLASEKKYEQAYLMEDLRRKMNDSIRSNEIANRTKDLQIKYETSKIESEVNRLNEEQSVKDLKLKQAQTFNFLLATVVALVIVALIIILHSYRQRDKINQQLVTANQTKDKLLSIIAHDIKNPLSAMQGLAGLLAEDHKKMDQEQLAMLITTMSSSSNKLYELLQNLLEWSITEAGGLAFQPEKLRPSKIVDDAAELFKAAIDAKKLTISNEIKPEIEVMADYKMLFSIVRNLLSNAIKFTPSGGTITMEANPESGMINIRLRDSGIGISDDRLPKLFDRAYTKSTNGTGLGLVLCKEFVERNGGAIKVESKFGEGTTFSFSLKKA